MHPYGARKTPKGIFKKPLLWPARHMQIFFITAFLPHFAKIATLDRNVVEPRNVQGLENFSCSF